MVGLIFLNWCGYSVLSFGRCCCCHSDLLCWLFGHVSWFLVMSLVCLCDELCLHLGCSLVFYCLFCLFVCLFGVSCFICFSVVVLCVLDVAFGLRLF